MIAHLFLFVLTSIAASFCFIGCLLLISGISDFMNRPMIMNRHLWIGKAAIPLSLLVVLLVPLNGWLIWRWYGALVLTVFWFAVTNTAVRALSHMYRPYLLMLYLSNPLFQAVVGCIMLVALTVINVVVR